MIARNKTWLLTVAFLLGTVFSVAAQKPSEHDAEAIALHAQSAFSQGQYAVAEKDYDELLQLGAHSAAVYSNLGVVYLREGKLDSAIAMLDKAKALAPRVAGIRLNLGLAYFRRREFKKASKYFREVLSMDQENTQARYLVGVCSFMMDDYSAAVRDFEPLSDRERNDLEFLFMLGLSYGMLHRDQDSARTFERLVESGGYTSHLHLLLGKAYLALGQEDKAESELSLAAQNNNLPFAHYYLGMLHRQRGQLDLATTEFRREIEVAPGNIWAYEDLAEIRMDQGDMKGAIALLEKGVARNPDTPMLLSTLGRAYLQISDTTRAIANLSHAITLDPQNSLYHYQLGRAYLKAELPGKADAEMRRARTLLDAPVEGKMEAISRDQNTPTVTDDPH
jgi:tetratricopeptide (TPR) repeat protein